jgi:deoxycytidine triphosphate deaminase
MLSAIDIRKRLGKDIVIFPFNKESTISGSSINITSSEHAWSIKKQDTIVYNGADGKEIKIPPNDTALIISNEAIHLSGRLAGTCVTVKQKWAKNGKQESPTKIVKRCVPC